MRQHAVAERRDEVGLRGGFAQRGDHVVSAGVEEGGDGAAGGEADALELGKRHVAWVVRWWTV